ncbi:MAG: hypothetical protein IKS17_06170 [Firmicutes bacterium]|nr:hypothetical protein [Bacillota bacterium]
MNEEQKHTPEWKGCIAFGIFNIILVLICTKLNIVFISSAMVLLIIVGAAVSLKSAKEDMEFGFKASAAGCAAGFLLQIFAGVLYVFNIISGFIGMFK